MRRALWTAVVTLLTGLVLTGWAVPANASPVTGRETGDEVSRMQLDYTVGKDGVLHVKETIDYRFASSGRHGIYRFLVTREPYVDDLSKDQKYEISDITVSSPSGAPDEFEETTRKTNGGRDETVQIKIGSPNETIAGRRATYVIEYDVRGALRHFDDHSELYWDATGSRWEAVLNRVDVTVTVPEGVQQVDCFAGPHGSTASCERKSISGEQGVFSASNLDRGEGLTIVAGITSGVVANDTPIIVDAPNWLERNGVNLPGVVTAGLVTLAGLTTAIVYGRRGNRDLRYAGMPPGTFPPAGSTVGAVKDTLSTDQIPVAFSPPPIPVGEGGLLIDAKANTTETAATLIDLAVRGAVRIDNTGDEQKAVLLNAGLAMAPHEQVLLQNLYPTGMPGSEITLERRKTGDNSMRRAHDAMISALREQIRARQWYTRMPWAARGKQLSGVFPCACIAMVGLWIFGAGAIGTVIGAATGGLGRAVVIGLPVLAVVVAIGTLISKRARGQRSPAGRAVTDQLIGFRTYLATAEADQLRFEEGEDIFSKYLPWAIAFGLADRWQRVCSQLVAAGRIPADPYWYVGPSYYSSGFAAGNISQTVAQTFDPPPAPSGSGGGGGSSSGFSGGSSGGGGGGGGGGSW
ncbi:hypothetical protein BWI15_20610 [Kribbella sp. ALI-6-A]|uniref:DUF2207 domain-containing protein n=1 Tax=Kribbella sp. ALI-6-A TaxID=1933817 RepID=UPI00097C0121|nr:DUF2207 domain-containing protein [Kribbella sp. ALI-6-A]ONI69048.1 hypothetical protein BWI15_20610 [Kribbella sp. ALI-6-A]